jgi:hypothetical protein
MEFEFDFNFSLWIRGLKIEADSEEEARDILRRMNPSEIIVNSTIGDASITNLDVTELEATYDVLVKDVHVSPAWWEFESDDERIALENKDFGEFNFTITVSEHEDLDDLIESELESATDISGSWTYTKEIIKKY